MRKEKTANLGKLWYPVCSKEETISLENFGEMHLVKNDDGETYHAKFIGQAKNPSHNGQIEPIIMEVPYLKIISFKTEGVNKPKQ